MPRTCARGRRALQRTSRVHPSGARLRQDAAPTPHAAWKPPLPVATQTFIDKQDQATASASPMSSKALPPAPPVSAAHMQLGYSLHSCTCLRFCSCKHPYECCSEPPRGHK
eukprot:6187868-Pleurochrysis_carterae.AAC.6